MGLDMYLTQRFYVKNWEHHGPQGQFQISIKKGGKKYPPIDTKRITYIITEVTYWRKANAVHNWFVNNVQDGNDDCKEYYVEEDKLRELRDLCVEVLKDDRKCPTLAPQLLPSQSGFFFGSTEYDEWYFKDLEHTVKELDRVLSNGQKENEFTGGSFYYQSSW